MLDQNNAFVYVSDGGNNRLVLPEGVTEHGLKRGKGSVINVDVVTPYDGTGPTSLRGQIELASRVQTGFYKGLIKHFPNGGFKLGSVIPSDVVDSIQELPDMTCGFGLFFDQSSYFGGLSIATALGRAADGGSLGMFHRVVDKTLADPLVQANVVGPLCKMGKGPGQTTTDRGTIRDILIQAVKIGKRADQVYGADGPLYVGVYEALSEFLGACRYEDLAERATALCNAFAAALKIKPVTKAAYEAAKAEAEAASASTELEGVVGALVVTNKELEK